jgi:predicted MFS family arabinose efflux permease
MRNWGGPAVVVTLAAAGVLMVTTGARQSMGLFVSPLNSSTGIGIATISFAMAVAQFMWGAAQPVAGALAERYGAARVLAVGVLLSSIGLAITPMMSSGLGLTFSLGFVMATGVGTSSFAVLFGVAAQRLPVERRGTASGIINAGSSLGQFVFAPLAQKLIQFFGWMGGMWGLALLTLAALPMVRSLTAGASAPAQSVPGQGMWNAVREAVRDPSYQLLNLGFFTCGFHIAFLVTHLPGEVELCGLSPAVAGWSIAIIGLANVVGSLLAGASISRYRGKHTLAVMYASRALLIGVYLAAPKTELTFYLFGAGLGLTWLATVPPTASIVGKLFGVRYLATLFGLTLLSHQIGGFLGAWLGGLAFEASGNYQWMWYADIALSAAAALVNLPIREPPVRVAHA